MRRWAVLVAVLASLIWIPGVATASGCHPSDARPAPGASLQCANLRGAHLDGLDLSSINLAGADLTGASLVRTTLVGAVLDDTTLAHANLTGANLGAATLTGANLTDARLDHANLGEADLERARLIGVDARFADLSQIRGTGVNLTGADLTGASLIQAQVEGATLSGTDLTGAQLDQAFDNGAVVSDTSGLFPVSALAGIVAAIVAWFALRPRRRSPLVRVTGFGILAGLLASVVALVIWLVHPSWTTFWVSIPVAFLLFIAVTLTLITAVHRVRRPGVALVLTLVGAVGAYAFCSAALAGVLDGLGITAFVQTCTSVDCAGGLTRGWTGLGLGVLLLVTVAVLARTPRLARPTPSLDRVD